MADLHNDPNPQLRQELNAALAILVPQIRGLQDRVQIKTTDEELAALTEELNALLRREGLINTAVASLDAVVDARNALDDDGYPDVPVVEIDPLIFQQMQRELADMQAAAALFKGRHVASDVRITFGAPENPPADGAKEALVKKKGE